MNAPEESQARRFTKRALLFVVAPALIAGFFSILPTIYTEIMKPRAELAYTIVSGPAIPVPSGLRRIFGVEIQNTGKVALTHVDVELNIPNGQIEDVETAKSLLHPKTSQQPPSVTIDRMLPGEKADISVMTLSSLSEPTLSISARSDEAVAIARTPGSDSTTDRIAMLAIAGAVLSAGSVAVMAGVTAVIFRRRGGRGLLLQNDRPDMITFIAGISGVIPMAESRLMGDHDITYARLADMFLFFGLKDNGDTRDRCVAGLEALLMVANITNDSVNRIRDNLALLGTEFGDAEFGELRAAASRANILSTRRRIFDSFRSFTSRDRLKLEDGGAASTNLP